MLVKILKGFYRGTLVTGTFPVVKPWTNSAKGGVITISYPIGQAFDSGLVNPVAAPRITCDQTDIMMLDDEGNDLPAGTVFTAAVQTSASPQVVSTVSTRSIEAFRSNETDEEAMERIRHTFDMLDKATDAVAAGIIRSLIVTGPPGIGKSFGVEKQLKNASLFPVLKNNQPNYKIVSGTASAIGLYQILYDYKDKESVLCFDDCDAILFDEDCLNLLKGALNSGSRREVSWNKESRILADAGVPDTFEFSAGIIFLTNINFENVRAGRIADHLKAIVSRSHYMDLEIDSMRDKVLRIKQCVADGMLAHMEFKAAEEITIVNWIELNKEYVRELSLRMVTKIGELVKAFPDSWREYAESTCLTKEARFSRLMAAKRVLPENNEETDEAISIEEELAESKELAIV